ncbi:MAG: virulence factor SrfB [Desulfovibrio sp.]|jgi:hypothetical protein|nr:virulence factor SrfB [Desulfovibrio sp.]
MIEMPHYIFPVSLIPGACPQFLDFEVALGDSERKSARFSRAFREERRPGSSGDGRENFLLHCLVEDDKGRWTDEVDGTAGPPPDYEVDSLKCLEAFLDRWVPLPFLRLRDMKGPGGEALYAKGPSNWARARIAFPTAETRVLRIVLVFDTEVEEPPEGGDGHFALSRDDVDAGAVFGLAWKARDNAWFLNAAWVDRWLFSGREEYRAAKGKKAESFFVMEYLAEYLTFLEFLHRILPGDRVRVVNPDRDAPVEADLILDIGNSRTTGIIVETAPRQSTDLNNSYLLQIRDLSAPENVYAEPFATRIEFVEPSFGDEAASRLSGRRNPAFVWASAVRMGPEAARLSALSRGAEGATGMSGPKRYLWDERICKPGWRFNTGGAYEPMVTRGSFARQVNNMGTPLSCLDDPAVARNPLYRGQEREIAFESHFTRSSLMMFLLAEVIMQALVTVNSPAQRGRRGLSDLPRRLRRIVFAVPSGMPVAEQRIYRRWVDFAVRTVWEALGRQSASAPPETRTEQGKGDRRRRPDAQCGWDEAGCTHAVYLYNEIIYKYHGDAHNFFRIYGRPRPAISPRPSLRAAGLDIGGGTTDLSIVTYSLDNDESSACRLRPHPEFHDGFSIAGDEILRAVITDVLLAAVFEAAAEHGVANPRGILSECFGRDVLDNSRENRNLRARFTRRAAVPVGLALLEAYEKSDPLRSAPVTYRLRDFFDPSEDRGTSSRPFTPAPPLPSELVDYVEKAVRRAAPGSAFSLLDVPVTVSPALIEKSVLSVMQRILSDLCEVIYLYGCDVLLLTGRPSRLHGVIAAVVSRLPVPADRIIPMCDYRVGRWYPFVDRLGMISDPKSTVAAGAILLALAEGHLEGFSLVSGGFRPVSTARFIGETDTSGRLPRSRVWFEVDVQSGKEQELEREVKFTGPLSVGFRQLAVERWPTTRFYVVDFASEEDRMRAAGKLPYTLTLRFLQRGAEEGTVADGVDEGELSILSVADNAGNPVRGGGRAVEVRLQTLPLDEGYWLDTGVLMPV